jgi:ferredoxin, 2Fe-2S
MSTVTIKPSGKTQEATEGQTMLQVIQAAGFPMVCVCNETGKFDACHIFVLEGRKGLQKMTKLENERLENMVGVASKSRFACLTVLGTEDATIELLGALSG